MPDDRKQHELQAVEGTRSLRWRELCERAKVDPEFARQLEAVERVMDRYRDTLAQLAKS